MCRSHLFGAVQRLEHRTEKPGLISKPPEAESSSIIQEYPKHREKNCSQAPIGLSARHSSLDNTSGGRGRRCRDGSAAAAPTPRRLVFASAHHLQQSPNRRGQAQRARHGHQTCFLPPLSPGSGTAEIPTFGKLLAMPVTGPAVGPELSRSPGGPSALSAPSFSPQRPSSRLGRISTPQSAGREGRHQSESALIKYTKKIINSKNNNSHCQATPQALRPPRERTEPLRPEEWVEPASLRLSPPPSASLVRPAPPEVPGSSFQPRRRRRLRERRRWPEMEPSPERVRALAHPPLAAALPSLSLSLPSLEVSSSSSLYFSWSSAVWGLCKPGFSHVLRVLVVPACWPLLDSPSKGRHGCPQGLWAGGDVLQQETFWLLIPR